MAFGHLRFWKKGDPSSAQHLNEPLNALSKMGELIGDGQIDVDYGPAGTLIRDNRAAVTWRRFVGKIVSSGTVNGKTLDDFADHRYWVKPQVANQASCENGISRNSYVDDPANPGVIKVENFHETVSGTHFILPGEIVHVYEVPDILTNAINPELHKFVMMETPKSFWGIVTSNGPCGDADFINERYWVTRQRIATFSQAPATDLTFGDFNNPPPILGSDDPCVSEDSSCGTIYNDNRHSVVVATNIAEYLLDTHKVPAGAIVELHWSTDEGGYPRYTFNHPVPTLSLGEYCQLTDANPGCAVNIPTSFIISDHTTKILFSEDDFAVSTLAPSAGHDCSDTIVIESMPINFRIENSATAGDQNDYCNIKNVVVNHDVFDGDEEPADASPITEPIAGKYANVFFHIDPDDLTVCPCSGSTHTRPSIYLSGRIYPCQFLPAVLNCDDTVILDHAQRFKFGKGMSVTAEGDCSSQEDPATATIDVNITSNSDCLTVTPTDMGGSLGCSYVLDLMTYEQEVVTDVVCYMRQLQVTKTTITVLDC